MVDTRLTRRVVLQGGLLLIAGCEATSGFDDPAPLAQWPEVENMTQPMPGTGVTQPLILWGSVVAAPNADSPVPNEQLANPFGLPMELLGIRFRITPVATSSDVNPRVTGGGVKVKLDLGAAPVATDIPLSLFGDMRDTYENGARVFSTSASAYAFPTAYDWRLKYPMFIPAGKVLTAIFTPIGINPISVRIDVMYICRTWDPTRPEPAKTKVPWAASFESKTFMYETSQAKDESVSANLDVINPFGVPLELSRISGRCTALNVGAAGGPITEYVYEDLMEFRSVLATMRMRSSRGFDLIRTPVPFDGVFPVNWRSWEILDGWQMAPQEYYRVQVNTIAVTDTVAAQYITTAQFSVGVVGYRDVDVASLRGAP